MRIRPLDVEKLAARRPVERQRFLMRRVIVVGSRQGMLIFQQREINRDAQRLQRLVTSLCSYLLIVVETGAEVNAAARSRLDLACHRNLLARPEGYCAQSNILPELLVIRADQTLGRQERVPPVAPDKAVTTAHCEFGGDVEENVDRLLTVIGGQRRSQQRAERDRRSV